MSHYYVNDENLAHKSITQSFELLGERFTLESDLGVFSKDGLDDGSRLLLETIAKSDLGKHILDLGCGIGSIGLLLAYFDKNRQLTLADVNQRALDLAGTNASKLEVVDLVTIVESDVYSQIHSKFDTIVTNPPIRAGKKVTYAMYAGALDHLNEGGRLILVIRKKQGADSCMRYLETLFKEVIRVKQKKGYCILVAQK